MRTYKLLGMSVCYLFFLYAAVSLADEKKTVEFFSSNNTREIDVHEAYERLKGEAQQELLNSIIVILQKNHIQQGRFEDILGAYLSLNDQHVTADNTEMFSVSPLQTLTDNEVFELAKQFAIALKQESVAVFIPTNQPIIGDVTVSLISQQANLDAAIKILHDKLPLSYSQAYSIHLRDECADYDNAKVVEIEWLGSKINPQELKKAFPLEKISYYYGRAFSIHQNGQMEQL